MTFFSISGNSWSQCRLSLIDLDSSLPSESDILVSFQKRYGFNL